MAVYWFLVHLLVVAVAIQAKPSASTVAIQAKPSATTAAIQAETSATTVAIEAEPSATTVAIQAEPSAATVVNTTVLHADIGRYSIEVGSDVVVRFTNKGEDLLGHIKSTIYRTDVDAVACPQGPLKSDSCQKWGNFILNITANDARCNNVELIQPSEDGGEVSVCFEYGESQWYGGSERYLQNWPIQDSEIDSKPLLTGYDWQSIVEGYWFNSDGVSIRVDPTVPLFVDSNKRNKGQLCLISKVAEPYSPRQENSLRYEICQYGDPTEAQVNAISHYFGHPTGRPKDRMFSEPIYSTWVRYGRDINQSKLFDLVSEIQSNSFPVGQIEIDDIWEKCYGAAEFDTKRFPDIKNFTDYVHKFGGRVTAWVYPFINEECSPAYEDAIDEGAFVKSADGNFTTTWWCGQGGAIDVTDEDTFKWYIDRYSNLMTDSGLDGYKFDAGETSYLPKLPKLTGDENMIPNVYVQKYGDAAAMFKGYTEIRVGANTQTNPLFVRMLDKDSRFGLDNGLQSVITTMFQMSSVGYRFILPDMIGGNAYGGSISKELFIRWLQLSVFMPALQFSVLPWDYDVETVEITRKFLALHASYSPLILQAADRAVLDGTPINTPIWWISPNDTDALKCRDEYLLADTVLAAPVVEEGAVSRDIYLPKGTWLDADHKQTIGPVWLRNYSAPLDTLPYFVRVPENSTALPATSVYNVTKNSEQNKQIIF